MLLFGGIGYNYSLGAIVYKLSQSFLASVNQGANKVIIGKEYFGARIGHVEPLDWPLILP